MQGHSISESAAERFWSKVEKTDGCWLWTGGTFRGYGVINIKGACCRAHRVSWVMHFGPIPDGLVVGHHCDTPSCVRPDHLFLGSQAGNLHDMYRKDRHPKGEDRGHAKLNDAAVVAMRARYAAGGVSLAQLAAEHGVSYIVVWKVVHRETWQHVP